MRKWLLILLLIPSIAGAIDIVRQGDLVVVKANCFAFNLTTINQKIPEGVTTLNQMALIFASSLRDLTPEEQAICTGTAALPPPPPPMWKVANNPSSTSIPKTRPYYELLDAITHSRSSKRGTVPVGDPCEQGDATYHKQVYSTTAWRYLAGQTKYVVLCEYK